MQIKQYRDSLKQGFSKQQQAIESTFKGLTAEQLGWRPDEKTWSVGQCLYHLWITNDKYLTNLAPVIRDSKYREAKDQDYEHGWFGQRFIDMIGPTTGQNTPVPKVLLPDYAKVPREVVSLLADQIEGVLEFLSESEGVDLRKTKMKSPVSPMVRLRLGDVFMALMQHNERHLNQATRLSRLSAFPPGARAGVS